MKYVIIGGVAGGATAAARLRRVDENAEIVMFERGEYISYANCGLPYHIGNIIRERDALLLQTPEKFTARTNISVRTAEEVVVVDKSAKSVVVHKSDGVRYAESYDKLLIATGASAIVPSFEGATEEGVYTLRNVSDMDNIISATKNKKRAIVIGGGFIGLEMAENLKHLGMDVTVIEMGDQIMGPLDYSMAKIVESHLLDMGVEVKLNAAVQKIMKENDSLHLFLSTGEVLQGDVVILSIGVKPNSNLALDAGLTLGDRGGIVVNEKFQTSDSSIYAVGDVIEYPHPLLDSSWMNFLAGPANRQARLVADQMANKNTRNYEGAIGTAIAKIFDLTVASTGMSAKQLAANNIPYQRVLTHPQSHASYYPGAKGSTLKLLFCPNSGKILGAQMIGYEGVDKRIDQIALLIKVKGSIYDLTALEHAYAPPYSSAKDPIAIAGYIATDLLEGTTQQFWWRELVKGLPKEAQLVDVRTKDEFELGSITGAINIPVDDLREQFSRLDKTQPIYLYCGIGVRGYVAERILRGKGFSQVKNLAGGYKHYVNSVINTKRDSREMKNACVEKGANINTFNEIIVDACGLQCPGPIIKLKNSMDMINNHDVLKITATDAGFARDAEAWCRSTGHEFMNSSSEHGQYTVTIRKTPSCVISNSEVSTVSAKGKTIIIFSDDLDKVLAGFVLANGAAATGKKVTLFFTFWGLNAIKKMKKPKVKKDIFAKMFSWMLPSSSNQLALSKMNMGGIGKLMMRYIMKQKGVASLEELRQQAIDNGVEFIACQMSMDVMGVDRKELLDEVSVGGVATYMNRAESANVNLFI